MKNTRPHGVIVDKKVNFENEMALGRNTRAEETGLSEPMLLEECIADEEQCDRSDREHVNKCQSGSNLKTYFNSNHGDADCKKSSVSKSNCRTRIMVPYKFDEINHITYLRPESCQTSDSSFDEDDEQMSPRGRITSKEQPNDVLHSKSIRNERIGQKMSNFNVQHIEKQSPRNYFDTSRKATRNDIKDPITTPPKTTHDFENENRQSMSSWLSGNEGQTLHCGNERDLDVAKPTKHSSESEQEFLVAGHSGQIDDGEAEETDSTFKPREYTAVQTDETVEAIDNKYTKSTSPTYGSLQEKNLDPNRNRHLSDVEICNKPNRKTKSEGKIVEQSSILNGTMNKKTRSEGRVFSETRLVGMDRNEINNGIKQLTIEPLEQVGDTKVEVNYLKPKYAANCKGIIEVKVKSSNESQDIDKLLSNQCPIERRQTDSPKAARRTHINANKAVHERKATFTLADHCKDSVFFGVDYKNCSKDSRLNANNAKHPNEEWCNGPEKHSESQLNSIADKKECSVSFNWVGIQVPEFDKYMEVEKKNTMVVNNKEKAENRQAEPSVDRNEAASRLIRHSDRSNLMFSKPQLMKMCNSCQFIPTEDQVCGIMGSEEQKRRHSDIIADASTATSKQTTNQSAEQCNKSNEKTICDLAVKTDINSNYGDQNNKQKTDPPLNAPVTERISSFDNCRDMILSQSESDTRSECNFSSDETCEDERGLWSTIEHANLKSRSDGMHRNASTIDETISFGFKPSACNSSQETFYDSHT